MLLLVLDDFVFERFCDLVNLILKFSPLFSWLFL